MPIRENQKMVVFAEKELVKALIEEEAKYEGLNSSNVIEKNMLERMLTSNKNINHWLKKLYTDGVSMKRFMESLWGMIADDWTDKMRKRANIELVKMAQKMAEGESADVHNKIFIGKYSPSYLNGKLDSIAKACENFLLKAKETEVFLLEVFNCKDISKNITTANIMRNLQSCHYQEELRLKEITERIYRLIELYSTDINNITLDEVYEIIIDSWEYVYQYPFTYKLLMELAKLQKNYCLEMRYAIRKAIMRASDEWH